MKWSDAEKATCLVAFLRTFLVIQKQLPSVIRIMVPDDLPKTPFSSLPSLAHALTAGSVKSNCTISAGMADAERERGAERLWR